MRNVKRAMAIDIDRVIIDPDNRVIIDPDENNNNRHRSNQINRGHRNAAWTIELQHLPPIAGTLGAIPRPAQP